MELTQDPSIWQTLSVLFKTLVLLLSQFAALGVHWLLWIVFAAWCLGGINWKKARHVLATGGWAPALLMIFLIALVWSRLEAHPGDLGLFKLPNFWWQLAYVSALAALAMFCGWLQTVFHWTPHDINLEPPTHAHGHGHH